MTVQEYLQTKVYFGGVPTPLGQVIAELETQGVSDRAIGLYIMQLLKLHKCERNAQ